jgi:hypothetical protein
LQNDAINHCKVSDKMKEKIISKAKDMFISLGFRALMDDIA